MIAVDLRELARRGSPAGAGTPSTVRRSSIGSCCSAIHARPLLAERVAGRVAALEVAMQHRGDLVLDLRAALDQPAAARHQPAQHPAALVADPHRRDQVGGQQVGEHLGVDLVGLHARVADRAHLLGVREHDLGRRAARGSARSPARCPSPPARPGPSARGSARTAQAARASSRSGRPSAPGRRRRSRPRRSRDARPTRSTCPPATSCSTTTTGERRARTTPTDSRSQRTRASRRGGQLHQRARSP